MKVEVLNCPNCNSAITDEKMTFCPYCGTRLFIDDGTNRTEFNKTVTITKNNNYVSRDETVIRQAELQDEQDVRAQKNKMGYIGLAVFLVILCVIGIMAYSNKQKKDEQERLRVGVYIQTAAEDYEGRDYQVVVTELKGLGFTNIQVKPVKRGLFKKEGAVERISINGDFEFYKNKYFRKDSPIIITYYKKDK